MLIKRLIKRINLIKFIIDLVLLVGVIIGVSGIIDDKIIITVYAISLIIEIISSDIMITIIENIKDKEE